MCMLFLCLFKAIRFIVYLWISLVLSSYPASPEQISSLLNFVLPSKEILLKDSDSEFKDISCQTKEEKSLNEWNEFEAVKSNWSNIKVFHHQVTLKRIFSVTMFSMILHNFWRPQLKRNSASSRNITNRFNKSPEN